MMGKRESLFTIFCLSIFNILCLIEFFINFSNINKIIDLLKLSNQYYDTAQIGLFKFVTILLICFTISAFIISFVFIAIKDNNVKKLLLITEFMLITLIFVFYFILVFNNNVYDLESYSNINSTNETIEYTIKILFFSNASYLIYSNIFIVLSTFASFHYSNLLYEENRTDEQIKNQDDSEINNKKSQTEACLENEIEKLKSKIRIKDLEKEYLSLKNKLDE